MKHACSIRVLDFLAEKIALIKEPYVYCHCSLRNLGLTLPEVQGLIQLLATLGERKTVIAPSFCFGTNAEYEKLLASGIDYCPANSPARVNIFGEMFRRYPGVLRSTHPLFPVLALGSEAQELLVGDHEETGFLGPRSVLGKLAEKELCILGMGVSIGTNSFHHFVDLPFDSQFPVARSAKVHCRILKEDGAVIHEDDYYTISADLRRRINPQAIHEHIQGQSFYSCSRIGEFPYYLLQLQPFLHFAHALAENYYQKRVLPPWWQS